MANTLILYDGKLSSTERVANSLGMIIGNVCIAEISEAPEDISPYDGFCFIFNFYGLCASCRSWLRGCLP